MLPDDQETPAVPLVVYRGFDFSDDSSIHGMSESERNKVIVSIRTDVIILRDILFLTKGLSFGMARINDMMEPVAFEPKITSNYSEESITYMSADKVSEYRHSSSIVEISGSLVRVDALFGLEHEWWIPKGHLVSASNLSDGMYLVSRHEIRKQKQNYYISNNFSDQH